jgi:putative membrane protein
MERTERHVKERGGAGSPIVHFLQGLLMGGADIIPGVSGGTMALIVGIYERLIHSIRSLAGAAVYLLRGRRAEARDRFAEVHWRLVLPLGVGILTALITGARFIPPLLERYPEGSRAIFFGLILGSLAIPWKRIEERLPVHYAIAAGAAIAAFLLTGLPPREVTDPPLLAVFFAAAIAICAMILPGVSGSFLLYVMGIYAATLAAVNARDVAYIAVFAAGAVIGLGSFSRIIDHLLRHRHDVTMAALVGLMAGSLRALWPWQDVDRSILGPPADGSAMTAVALAVLGFAAVTALVWFGNVAESRGATEPERG